MLVFYVKFPNHPDIYEIYGCNIDMARSALRHHLNVKKLPKGIKIWRMGRKEP